MYEVMLMDSSGFCRRHFPFLALDALVLHMFFCSAVISSTGPGNRHGAFQVSL